MSRGADVGGAVVVGLEARTLPLMTLTPEDTDEGQLELPVVAGVDDGVQAAVEVAQPEDDFEEDFRRAQVHIKRPWRGKSRGRRSFSSSQGDFFRLVFTYGAGQPHLFTH